MTLTAGLVYLVLGACTGVLSGMLGVGGGIIVVPVLLWAFHIQGIAGSVAAHLAIGTSLAAIVFTSAAAIQAQQKRRAIDWSIVAQLAPGTLLGSFGSGLVSGCIPGAILKSVFAVFLLIVALQLLLRWSPAPKRDLPGRATLVAAGLVIGAVSGLVGIGGGTMTVPFLHWRNVDLRRAVAISSALGLPIAVAGALGFIISGWGGADLPPESLGYVSVPAVVGITITSMLTAPIGVKLAHSLPVASLRRGFGVFLLVVSLRLLVSG